MDTRRITAATTKEPAMYKPATVQVGALNAEAATAKDEVVVRVHLGERTTADDEALRYALPIRVEREPRATFNGHADQCGELEYIEAMATEWSWDARDACPRMAWEETFGPYTVGKRTEWDVVVRERADVDMDAASNDTRWDR